MLCLGKALDKHNGALSIFKGSPHLGTELPES